MFGRNTIESGKARTRSALRGLAASAAGVALAAMTAHPAAAESRSWVINWLDMAMYSQDGDCKDGVNPLTEDLYRFALKALGNTTDQIEETMKGFQGGAGAKTRDILVNRARINGQPANAYTNPLQAPDPNLHLLTGKYAYGFNLDGKGTASPNSFEDPETHEKGVNNQLARAFGCIQSSRTNPAPNGDYPRNGAYWEYVWDVIRDTMPAWVITVSGDDLSKDGAVTVDVDRAVDHVVRDANGETLAGTAFRVASDPRSRNHYTGTIKNGVVAIQPGGDFHMEGDDMLITQFDFKNAHLRLRMRPDGNLDGILSGYQSWMPVYFMYGGASYASEAMIGVDFPGIFNALKKTADYEPDPKTGQNQRISASYRITAVPAFALPPGDASKTAQAAQKPTQTASP